MAAKKKKKTKAAKTQSKMTAIKLVVHRAAGEEVIPGVHRYVISGMLVSTKPLENFPSDYDGSLVFEDVEQGSFGFSMGSMIHITLSGMKTRAAKQQGYSADQYLTSLREV